MSTLCHHCVITASLFYYITVNCIITMSSLTADEHECPQQGAGCGPGDHPGAGLPGAVLQRHRPPRQARAGPGRQGAGGAAADQVRDAQAHTHAHSQVIP